MTTITHRHPPEEAEKEDGRRQARIDGVLNMTPREIDRYIDRLDLSDEAEVKRLFKRLAKLVIFTA